MNEDFVNKIFLNKMNEIKEKNAELGIHVFICILDKMIDPKTSNSSRSAYIYKYSVDLWNNYVFSSKKNFDLLHLI